MFNRKCRDIISKIIEMEEFKIKDIAEYFNVSDRSIRYYLEEIGNYLEKNNLGELRKISKGEFKFSDKKAVRNHFAEKKLTNKILEPIQREREEYILVEFIFKNRINLVELSEKLGVSRTTLKNDLKSLFLKLKNNQTKLITDKKGLFLKCEENITRMEFLRIFVKEFSQENLNKFIKQYLFEDFEIEIRKYLHEIEENLDSNMSDEAFNTLLNYLKITIGRIKSNNQLLTVENENFLSKSSEFALIEQNISALEKKLGIQWTYYEKLKLTDLIQGSQMNNPKFSYYENWITMDIMVQKIILEFSKQYGQNFSEDYILFRGLLNHLKPLIYRLRNNQKLENSIHEEVIEIYPKLFYLTQNSLIEFEEFIQMTLTPDEIAFILMHFKGAIDRNRPEENIKKKILIVCGQGFGTSNLLAQQMIDNYEIEIVDTIPVHRFGKYLDENGENFDSVISTVSNSKKILNTKKEVIEVTAMLTTKDRDLLNFYGFQSQIKKVSLKELMEIIERNCHVFQKDKLQEELISSLGNLLYNNTFSSSELSKFLPKENILLDLEAENWQEAVKLGGEVLLKQDSITESYISSMIEVVENFGSYIVVTPNFAMPHSRECEMVKKSSASLIRLKKPVLFPGNKAVTIIFTFASKDNKAHLKALTELTEFLLKEDSISKIMKAKNSFEVHKEIL